MKGYRLLFILLLPMLGFAASKKVSDFPSVPSPASGDLFFVARGGETNFNVTYSNLKSNIVIEATNAANTRVTGATNGTVAAAHLAEYVAGTLTNATSGTHTGPIALSGGYPTNAFEVRDTDNTTLRFNVTTNGNVYGTAFYGDGSHLTGIQGASSGGSATNLWDSEIHTNTATTEPLALRTINVASNELVSIEVLLSGGIGTNRHTERYVFNVFRNGSDAPTITSTNDVDRIPFALRSDTSRTATNLATIRGLPNNSGGWLDIKTNAVVEISSDFNVLGDATFARYPVVNRTGSGDGAGDLWGWRLQNAGGNDAAFLFGSSSAYQPDGTIEWIPSSAFGIYVPSVFRIGKGTGATDYVEFDGGTLVAQTIYGNIAAATNAAGELPVFVPDLTSATNAAQAAATNSAKSYADATFLASTQLITPQKYGAVGDGLTDDAAAFSSALLNGTVYVPPGTYRIGSSLTVTGSLWSAGARLLFDAAVNNGLYVTNGATVSGVIIDGSGAANYTGVASSDGRTGVAVWGVGPVNLKSVSVHNWGGIGVLVTGPSEISVRTNWTRIEGLTASNCWAGLWLQTNSQSEYTLVTGSYLARNRVGMRLGSANVNASGSTLRDNSTNLWWDSGGGSARSHSLVSGNILHHGNVMINQAGTGGLFQNNTVLGVANFTLETGNTNVIVRNNFLEVTELRENSQGGTNNIAYNTFFGAHPNLTGNGFGRYTVNEQNRDVSGNFMTWENQRASSVDVDRGVYYRTNQAASTIIDMTRSWAAYNTNNNVAIDGLANVGGVVGNRKLSVQVANVIYTNTSGSTKTIALPASVFCRDGSTLTLTNIGILTLRVYPNMGTNATWDSLY